ncbi:ATP-binding cassette sub-family G member 5-like isoform X1 [Mytilus galloprovincialis]|uniref:ATP-binding cassette, subfamily G (WHITE), member 5 (Sterolin 1) n=2 Tax=Mytilus galloprovincialis TaxID=29158 RepID=A0A8B6FNA5_MYTGA|nr:ATP-binding cassette, subfamily G (WHITE), member 5 (sterolin 1) [Mytilus galloprovincialis]
MSSLRSKIKGKQVEILMEENACFYDLTYYLNGCTNQNPDADEDERQITPTLNLLNISYNVSEFLGPWWKGACFRQKKQKRVLNDINIQFRSGELTAILGSSGSGKTSLLDIIASRSNGQVGGKVYYNNYLCTAEVIKQYAAYVMQADRLLHNLTVRETIRYAALLRLPGKMGSKEIDEKVDKAIAEMGLKHVADSRVGGSVVRGISGGERRRVTIAIQLLQDPKILLLDEPTTGLDSCTTRHLVSSLSDIAHNGKIVILTIHQPRSDVFKMFDKIGLLSMGEMVYFGKSGQMVEYFQDLGYPCPTYASPFDHYVDLASIDRRNHEREIETMSKVQKLVQAFSNSSINDENIHNIEEETMRHSTRRTMLFFFKPQPPSLMRVLYCLIGRMLVNLKRDRTIYMSRLIMLSLFVPFVCAFLGHIKTDQKSIQDRIGLMYQSVGVPTYVGILIAVGVFPPLRDLYFRECRDGLYSTTSFLLSYAIHVIPFQAISAMIFSIIVYWVTGLHPSWSRFAIYYATIFVLHFIGEIMTVGVMGVFFNPQIANSTSALILSASVLIATGFLRSFPSMLDIFQWGSWLSVMKYSAEILVANEFSGLNFTCPPVQNIPCQYPTGEQYLADYYPDAVEHMRRNFWALGGFMVSFLFFTIVAFKIRGIPNMH